MNTTSFYEFRSEQAQALEVTFSRRKQNLITHKPVSTIN